MIDVQSIYGSFLQREGSHLSVSPSRTLQPVWAVLTQVGPDVDGVHYYEWKEVYPDDNGKWTAHDDNPEDKEGYHSFRDGDTLLEPAVEINGHDVELNTIVRLLPTQLVERPDGTMHRAWLFSTAKGQLRPFRLKQDLIPTGGGELDTTVYAEWLDEPGKHVWLFPEHRTGWPSGDQFISLGIGRGPGMAFRGTYGWAKWVAHGTELGEDYDGEIFWRGEWQIVTLYADLIAQAVIYGDAIEPGEPGIAKLLWFNKSGYEIKLFNDLQVRLEVGMIVKAYFSRPHYIWVPFDVPTFALYAKVQTGWAANLSGVESRTVPVKSCWYDGTKEEGDEFNVKTQLKETHDTALWKDSVVQYHVLSDGTKVIENDIWDRPIGTVLWEAVNTANIRKGWKLCDGQFGTVDLRGRFIMSVDPADKAEDGSENAIGDTGGFRWHGTFGGVPENNHDDHEPLMKGAIDEMSGTVYPATPSGVDSGGDTMPIGWGEYLESTAVAEGNIDDQFVHSDTDNRPRFYVLAAIQRVT